MSNQPFMKSLWLKSLKYRNTVIYKTQYPVPAHAINVTDLRHSSFKKSNNPSVSRVQQLTHIFVSINRISDRSKKLKIYMASYQLDTQLSGKVSDTEPLDHIRLKIPTDSNVRSESGDQVLPQKIKPDKLVIKIATIKTNATPQEILASPLTGNINLTASLVEPSLDVREETSDSKLTPVSAKNDFQITSFTDLTSRRVNYTCH